MSAGSVRRWGWHRLQPEWAERVVSATRVRPGELVLDLGAGTGALTWQLAQAGARVLAVELHPGRVAALRRRFADQPQVRIISVDLVAFRLPARPFRVVANPPYAVRAQLQRRLLAHPSRMYAADLVLPRAYVHRVLAQGTGRPGWQATGGLRLPRSAFEPPPPVDSAVLQLRRR
ncbi:MAG: rRNA adenine N-6-methyltransferase family protein [Nocardioidaceae bacterium]